jgi:beta-galactosidase
LLLKETEAVPVNQTKKRAILAALLRNLKAPFSGSKAVIAGGRLTYQPIDISKFAKQYRNEQGWFGDKRYTFKELPVGEQTFAGVSYQVFEFATSPVPTVIMLGGPGIPNNPPQEVKGIPVNRKADALFFLHTARLDQRRNQQEVKQDARYEMLRYVVTYADGGTESIPIYAEIDIEHYVQKSPAAIPGAQIAWVRPYEGTDLSAVAYSKQWNNPHPEKEIKTLDVVYGAQRRGVPAVLAITAAEVSE